MRASSLSRSRVRRIAAAQDGILGRRQLYRAGVTRSFVRAQLRARRWQRTGRMSVCAHTGPLPRNAQLWRAVLEVGPHAVLDGLTALEVAGLKGVDSETIHVTVPKSSRPRKGDGIRVHETRRYDVEDVSLKTPPRMRTPVAVVHAALWAATDREATLVVLASLQQRLTTVAEVSDALQAVRRDRRRSLLWSVLDEAAGGVHALSELDFARLCREAGLPEPSRQVLKRTPTRRRYLDVLWEAYRVAVEIDGRGHLNAATWWDDTARQNDLVIGGLRVLRFPAAAVRLDPGRVLDQVRRALVEGGWRQA